LALALTGNAGDTAVPSLDGTFCDSTFEEPTVDATGADCP
jgi:hypothetical protein